ncbi:ArsR/SmtB family transcription factor [Paenibacillus lemnae]|uniref:Winged helix-turn-helix transcriptional regulator n=1 Tax=Paenibacillus lemnae TaxID=1330551 RepID=A0A848MAD3_PAELE|nr:metalloregulator ArsR/SmtB family transcription factor [Paenibacillus lemnae]NMO98027.1 winged helix-turn-helix transcriptional regulator [Paenibacillus lemnae]
MEQINEIADKLKLLGDKTRLTILALLTDREWCVCEFVDLFDMSQPAVSQHLRKLKSQGLVSESRRGQWVYYSLNIDDKPYIRAVLNEIPSSQEVLSSMNKEINCDCD